MQFAITQEGETLSRLAERLYCSPSKSELKRFMKLIEDANPNLKARGKILSGTIVIVPEAKGIATTNDVRTEREIAASFIRDIRQQIGDLEEVLAPLLDHQEKEARVTLDLVKSRGVQRLARTESLVRNRLADITKAGQERLKRTKALQNVQKKAMDELESDFNDLLGMLDPGEASTDRVGNTVLPGKTGQRG